MATLDAGGLFLQTLLNSPNTKGTGTLRDDLLAHHNPTLDDLDAARQAQFEKDGALGVGWGEPIGNQEEEIPKSVQFGVVPPLPPLPESEDDDGSYSEWGDQLQNYIKGKDSRYNPFTWPRTPSNSVPGP